ncbi:unnamed protein product, partial [Mesorhabditis spiculigera]
MISWCNEKYRCTRCHNNEHLVDDLLMKRREFENDTGILLADVDLEVFRENVPRLINCIKCYQKYHHFTYEPENTWISLEEAQVLVHSNAIQRYVDTIITPLATLLSDAFRPKNRRCVWEKIGVQAAELVETIDKMREGKEVTVAEKEKWVKKAVKKKIIPAEFTSEHGLRLYIGIREGEWKSEDFKGKTDLQKVYYSFIEGLGNIRKDDQQLWVSFSATKSCDIIRMINILHSPPFREVLSKTRCMLSLSTNTDHPTETAVYEWAGVWKQLLFNGLSLSEDGINFSTFVIRSIQNLLNGGTSNSSGLHLHNGPWHFPFIGEKQRNFEEKYNVRIVLITVEGNESERRYLWILPRNKPNIAIYFIYDSDRYFKISMGSPSDIAKYEQAQLGIVAKDEEMKLGGEDLDGKPSTDI